MDYSAMIAELPNETAGTGTGIIVGGESR